MHLLGYVVLHKLVKPALFPGLNPAELEVLLLRPQPFELNILDVPKYREKQSLPNPIMCAPSELFSFWHVERGLQTYLLLVQESSYRENFKQ